MNNICKICKTKISIKSKYCRKCYQSILSKRNQSGFNNACWRGGRTKHSRGYIYVKKRQHPFSDKQGYIFEHRLIMEEKLGRYLTKKEIVHHINGIVDDNRIENLELTTQSQHINKHITIEYLKNRIPWNKKVK